jgi:hypothetical protein
VIVGESVGKEWQGSVMEDSLLERVTEVSEIFCLGRFLFLRLAPILPRRGSAQPFPPSRAPSAADSQRGGFATDYPVENKALAHM